MGNRFSLKNKRIIAPLLAVTVLTGSVLGIAVSKPIPAYAAKVTLKGINDIADQHTYSTNDANPAPFIILEVVPDKARDAAIGYLVAGEEPIHEGKSPKDMPSTAERNKYINRDLTDPDNPKLVYDPRSIDTTAFVDPSYAAPNFGNDRAAAYELNGKAFTFSDYYEPKAADATQRNMEVRGHFVQDDHGDYVYNDFGGDDAYKKKYADEEIEDPELAGNQLYDVSSLYGKAPNPAEGVDEIYRRSASFRAKDDYYTGSYIFDIEKLIDESVQMPVLVDKDPTFSKKSGNNLYNMQYFKLTLVTDTDQLVEGAVLYRAIKGGTADNPDYYGYVKKNDAGELVVRPKNFGDDLKDENGVIQYEDDNVTPKKVIDIKVSDFGSTTLPVIYFRSARRMSSAAPLSAGSTPMPTVTPTSTPTGSPDPNATPTPTETPTPDGDQNTPAVTPTADGDQNTPTSTPTGDGDQNTAASTPTAGGNEQGSSNPDQQNPDQNNENSQNSGENDQNGQNPDPNEGASIGNSDYGIDRYVTYGGLTGKTRETAVLGALRTDLEYDYYILEETTAGDTSNTLYCIDDDSVVDNANGAFGRKTGYGLVFANEYSSTNASADKGPYYVKIADADEYSYDPAEADPTKKYRFVTDYTESIYHQIEYSGGFVNNEWFKQYVLDREEGKACEDLYIDVVTVTAGELAQNPDFVNKAHLIYFAGGRYQEDISAANAVAIFNRVTQEDFPVMIERSMYYANLYDPDAGTRLGLTDPDEIADANAERVNITLLALELMQTSLPENEISVSDWQTIAGTSATAADADTFYTRPDAEIIVTEGGVRKGYYSGTAIADENKVSSKRAQLLDKMRYSYKSDKDVSYVQGTVFVNDDWNDENKTDTKYGSEIKTAKIVRADFNTQYSDEKINGIGGFQEIYDEYDNERPIIETYGSWNDFNSAISKATCIRYILNAHNNRFAVKAKLRILDIEPLETAQYNSQSDLLTNLTYNGSQYAGPYTWEKDVYDRERDYLTSDWVKTNLEFEGDTSAIAIKQMGTREFIGINTDLNETYDMIYIGMDTGLMNTAFGSSMVKTRKTLYNNTDLNELVYAHMGDSLEHSYYDAHKAQRHGSGNDITLNKKNELINYLKAGYTILLSDDFFKLDENKEIVTNEDGIVTADSINTTKLDSSSQLYDFIANTVLSRNDEGYVYFRKNVYRRGELEKVSPGFADARRRFARYLNISKLEVVVNKAPIEYNERISDSETAHHYLEPNGDGSYSLDFEVQLKNDVALDASSTSYNCKLYIDYDSDGKFESDEELGGIMVNGQTVDGDGLFYLKTGETYSISRAVPEDYIGFLPWKLSFIQNEKETGQSSNDITSVRVGVTGFCAVPADPDNRPTIKVLQILPNKRNNADINTLDLRADAFTNPTTGWYSQVRDFDVDVRQIYADDYVRKKDTDNNANSLSYFDYLCQYDMIVLGFADCYEFTPYDDAISIPVARTDANGNPVITYRTDITKAQAMHDALLAVREYCISGRSVLFTHDLTSANNNDADPTSWGYYMNQLLRDVQGLDRYGHSETTDLKYIFDAENTVKNYEYVYDNNRSIKGNEIGDDMGYTDVEVFRNKRRGGTGGNWGATTRLITYDYDVEGKASKWTDVTETVTAINEGQITQYPFLITEGTSGDNPESQFEVSMTHSQYYQLDLDTNFNDTNLNDDIIVWYAIGNRDNGDSRDESTLHEYYRALHNDVRNNYYIFTKGNVTYTGSGHSAVNSAREQQLFVNTLVAAYNSGVRSPKVIYKENPWEQAAQIKGINIPYDVNLTQSETADDNNGGWLEDTVTINFKTVNNNFKGSKNGLNTRYFVEVAPGTGTLNLKGQSFKEITPTKFCLMEYDGTKNYAVNPYLLENYRIYQATFNTSDLDLAGISGALPADTARIYIQIGTDTLSTGDVEALQPYESLPTNMLGIYTTRLFDLQ